MSDRPFPHEHVSLLTNAPDAERLAALAALYPDAMTEGRVDLEKLAALLGQPATTGAERYSFSWAGKRDAIRAAQTPSNATLIPEPGQWVDSKTTQNLIIEGDNLEALKLLQERLPRQGEDDLHRPAVQHGQRVHLPRQIPEGLQDYLRVSGQRTQGTAHRQHRIQRPLPLRVALDDVPAPGPRPQLLARDGVIFVSIDDHEVQNLRILMNEVFGEENSIACFIWHRRQMADRRNRGSESGPDHEYVVAYRKSEATFRGNDIDLDKYQNSDNDPRGPWFSADITGLATREQRPNLHYTVVDPQTGIAYPPSLTRGWSCSRETFQRYIEQDQILWPAKSDGRPRLKRFLRDCLESRQNVVD